MPSSASRTLVRGSQDPSQYFVQMRQLKLLQKVKPLSPSCVCGDLQDPIMMAIVHCAQCFNGMFLISKGSRHFELHGGGREYAGSTDCQDCVTEAKLDSVMC